ncbi:hypothetical protein DENSPDRAFT_479472 [Dentipellis sp. KUC8613]|nr:hypothetical protein DENSPDRAFT_479472 [Dentipellis sp. KUC8613]
MHHPIICARSLAQAHPFDLNIFLFVSSDWGSRPSGTYFAPNVTSPAHRNGSYIGNIRHRPPCVCDRTLSAAGTGFGMCQTINKPDIPCILRKIEKRGRMHMAATLIGGEVDHGSHSPRLREILIFICLTCKTSRRALHHISEAGSSILCGSSGNPAACTF